MTLRSWYLVVVSYPHRVGLPGDAVMTLCEADGLPVTRWQKLRAGSTPAPDTL
jgi:hypothetical protein